MLGSVDASVRSEGKSRRGQLTLLLLATGRLVGGLGALARGGLLLGHGDGLLVSKNGDLLSAKVGRDKLRDQLSGGCKVTRRWC